MEIHIAQWTHEYNQFSSAEVENMTSIQGIEQLPTFQRFFHF